MNYTALSLAEIRSGLEDIARDVHATFGGLDARQLNWRPDESRWSVAQCFQHLVTSNELALQASKDALGNAPRSLWQRIPALPRLVGPALINSQAPTARGKYKAPSRARPTASDISGDILDRFIVQQRVLADWMGTLDERSAARAVMSSPFVRFVAYSVLDGCRLILAHEHRHIQQARRMTETAGFPNL